MFPESIDSTYILILGMIAPTFWSYFNRLVEYIVKKIEAYFLSKVISDTRVTHTIISTKNSVESRKIYDISTYLQDHAEVGKLNSREEQGMFYYNIINHNNMTIICQKEGDDNSTTGSRITMIIYALDGKDISTFIKTCTNYASNIYLYASGEPKIIIKPHPEGCALTIPINMHIPQGVVLRDKIKYLIDKYMRDEVSKVAILLHGPPGTGKTTVIKKIIEYTQYNAISLKDCNFDGSSTFKRFCYSPETMLKYAPGQKGISKRIFYGEEIDLIWKLNREKSNYHSSITEIKTALSVPSLDDWLVVLDGVNIASGIFVFTTNNISAIDEAFYRPGRVDLLIEMNERVCAYSDER